MCRSLPRAARCSLRRLCRADFSCAKRIEDTYTEQARTENLVQGVQEMQRSINEVGQGLRRGQRCPKKGSHGSEMDQKWTRHEEIEWLGQQRMELRHLEQKLSGKEAKAPEEARDELATLQAPLFDPYFSIFFMFLMTVLLVSVMKDTIGQLERDITLFERALSL